MKKSILSLVISILLLNTLFAAHSEPTSTRPPIPISTTFSLSDIFLSGDNGTTLFVDFLAVEDQINQLNITRAGTVVLKDEVSDLPGNTIYEINLSVFRAGVYCIELQTSTGECFEKVIIVE